jgi:hypothetical protein
MSGYSGDAMTGAEKPSRALKDWPQLDETVAAKIDEQQAFVANWDATVRPAGYQGNIAAGQYYSAGDAETAWGFSPPTVSRWRTSLKHPDRYHERIVVPAEAATGPRRLFRTYP